MLRELIHFYRSMRQRRRIFVIVLALPLNFMLLGLVRGFAKSAIAFHFPGALLVLFLVPMLFFVFLGAVAFVVFLWEWYFFVAGKIGAKILVPALLFAGATCEIVLAIGVEEIIYRAFS
jgi:hypothetical protein